MMGSLGEGIIGSWVWYEPDDAHEKGLRGWHLVTGTVGYWDPLAGTFKVEVFTRESAAWNGGEKYKLKWGRVRLGAPPPEEGVL